MTDHPFRDALQPLTLADGRASRIWSLPWLDGQGVGPISRLPVSLRVVLESLLRNLDGARIHERDVRALAGWRPNAARTEEVPFIVARVLLQDFTGVPLLVDLAAMRQAMRQLGKPPTAIEPLVPVDLVVDHSVQVDYHARPDAFVLNLDAEYRRNRPRYEFLKWGRQAFQGLRIVPPGIGICHQVNLEHLARVVLEREGVCYPDTCVGTDSHTPMVNGVGVVGWGVGGIEAEAGMLGQPVTFLMPDVVGVHLSGALRPGVTATDLVLRVTELLRQTKVVGKFVEYFGEGAAALAVPERATISNMTPEYGATIGYFPVDERTLEYLRETGRPAELVEDVRRYYEAQGMFGVPRRGAVDYSTVVELDLASITTAVAGPRRPQDRIELGDLKRRFAELLAAPAPAGYGKPAAEAARREAAHMGPPPGGPAGASGGGAQDPDRVPDGRLTDTSTLGESEMMNNRPTPDRVLADGPAGAAGRPVELGHGSVVIAAITSCTNTSNPSVMLGAGLLARKAVARGLSVPRHVKTSLAPGSRVVTDYLERAGLQRDLDRLGFHLAGYGCTTCIGNSGPLDPGLDRALAEHDLIAASVLSGNRNFEARVHGSVKANFLMSPPLVVAFALAGRVDVDLTREPIGRDRDGRDVFLRDLWPTPEELAAVAGAAADPETYRRRYADTTSQAGPWNRIPSPSGDAYAWDPASTYIQEPPYFEGFGLQPTPPDDLVGARALAIFGDSVTTDHISPAGSIKPSSPAGLYLQARGVAVADFNSYGARRGNHEVMVRGTFANVRIRNLMAPGTEGGVTRHQPDGEAMSIFDAAERYRAEGVPLVVVAGQEYGTGSSRDWAAKGPRLLGVRAVVARGFERIHRSNLIGMGILPCQLAEGTSAASLELDGTELYELRGVAGGVAPRQAVRLIVRRRDGRADEIPVTARIDTPIEAEYYRHGGILPFVLRQIVARAA